MVTSHIMLVRKLAEIDQLLAHAYAVGDDCSLKIDELFSVCDSVESLERSRRNVEAKLRGESSKPAG